jgi:hypothetical protein
VTTSLTPILVAGFGRSGTTALMAMLGHDPRVVMGRAYPFEDRYLTYLAKRELLLDRPEFVGGVTDEQLCMFDDNHVGAYRELARLPAADAAFASRASERVRALWELFSAKARRAVPSTRFYAEKAPAWLAAFLRDSLSIQTVYLFRDPRDLFLSANALMRRRNYYSFGRVADDSDLDHARSLAYEYLLYYENYRADVGRTDCHLVRYGELVREPEQLADRLGRRLGVHASAIQDGPDLEVHQTTATLADSLDRWRREPLPPGVGHLFEAVLAEAMRALGYEVPATPASAWPMVEFARVQESVAAFSHSVDGVPEPGGANGLRVRLTGEDFWLILPVEPFDAAEVREVWVSLWGQAGNHCSLYWCPPGSHFAEERCLHLRHPAGRHWRVLRFRVGQHPLWRGRIGQLRLDPFNGSPSQTETPLFVRWVRAVG